MIVRNPYRDRYFQLSKISIEDHRLSWKARGIHAFLMSKPDNWNVIVGYLVDQSDKDGRDSVRAALMELEEYGYIRRTQGKSRKGQFDGVECHIFEEPPISPDQTADGFSGGGLSGGGKSPPNEYIHIMNNDLMNNSSTHTPAGSEKEWGSDVKELTSLLSDWITKNGYKALTLGPKQWSDMDKLLRIDKRTPEEVRAVIDWCQTDAFWNGNIRSTMKLRKHFDSLLGKMRYEGVAPAAPEAMTDDMKYRALAFDAYDQGEEWYDCVKSELTLDNPAARGYSRPTNSLQQLIDAHGNPYVITVQGKRKAVI